MKGLKNYIIAQKYNSELYSSNLEDEHKNNLYKKYIMYLRKSAYLGNSEAQYELGLQYDEWNFFGKNLNYNPKKCAYWYKKACNGGVGEACNSLAIYYENGIVVEKDNVMALNFYKKAIELDCHMAVGNLKKLKLKIPPR